MHAHVPTEHVKTPYKKTPDIIICPSLSKTSAVFTHVGIIHTCNGLIILLKCYYDVNVVDKVMFNETLFYLCV